MAETLTYTPSRQSSKSTETRVLRADLGDGYSQRAGDGINVTKQMWTLVFPCEDSTTAIAIYSFFEDKGGSEYFYWTPFRESTPRKFICSSWSETFLGNSNTAITAQLEEVFDLS
jgi:phage-related protein